MIDKAGKLRDLSEVIADIDADTLAPRALARLAKLKPDPCRPFAARRGSAPASHACGNFVAVGLNYADHAAETGAAAPKEPVLFNKAPSCIVGPNDDIVVPKGSTKPDWEVELAVVIGTRASYVERGRRAEPCGWLLHLQ